MTGSLFRVNLQLHVIKAAKLYSCRTIVLYYHDEEEEEEEEDVVSPADNCLLSGDQVTPPKMELCGSHCKYCTRARVGACQASNYASLMSARPGR